MILSVLAWPHEILSSGGYSSHSLKRENSFLAFYDTALWRTMPSPVVIPLALPSLPIIPDRPRRPIVFASQTSKARVEKVLSVRYGSGQCVALARAISGLEISGSAYLWPTLAKNEGYTVDKIPAKGAVIVTSESSYGTYTGHVLVQTGDVVAGYIPVIEQNYISRTVTVGWLPASSPVIVAFIHK